MTEINIIAPIRARPKQRARVTRWGSYTPQQTIDAEAEIREYATPCPMLDGALSVHMDIAFKVPKSWSKKKKQSMIGKDHTQTPDADNVEKLILDALNGIAYADDKQISRKSFRKYWGDKDFIKVTIAEVYSN